MPIGADLVLNQADDPESTRLDGRLLGQVVERSARLYETPLAVPLMDLRLEKVDLLLRLGIPERNVDLFHFEEPPDEQLLDASRATAGDPFPAASQAHFGAIRYIASETDLVPIGMLIGPFSLMTKLLVDPIVAVAMAGMGLTAEEDPSVLLAERALLLAEQATSRSLRAQIEAGAKAVIVCEPAANIVYLSPKMLSAGADTFERLVMEPNLRLRRQMRDAGIDLVFHDCGELNHFMVEQFATRLDPAILSLGSSRTLWEDARLVPDSVVLFGNLPTKTFYSDAQMPVEEVERRTCELIARMRATGHPHILGSECDVLFVPDAIDRILRKVEVMCRCRCA